MKRLTLLALATLLAACQLTPPPRVAAEPAPRTGHADLDHLHYDQVTWVAAHNAYHDNTRQLLERGARGLLWDLYPNSDGGQVRLCHRPLSGYCGSGSKNFSDELNHAVLPFLRDNPDAIITLILEARVSRPLFEQALAQVPGLHAITFDATAWRDTPQWPTLAQLREAGQRLIIFNEQSTGAAFDISGDYSLGGQRASVLLDHQWQVQNQWNLGNAAMLHDWSCASRWPDVPMTTTNVAQPGFNGWNRIFVMNQFHGFGSFEAHAASVDNNLTHLKRRVNEHCRLANAGVWRKPNFIVLDYLQAGDQFAYAATLNRGGVQFFEGNNATQDSVCTLDSRHRELRLPAAGCENDEARSMRLTNLPAGHRITLWDSPDGNEEDDSLVLVTQRAIGDYPGVVIDSFEQTRETADYRMTYSRNNGLDGKVSRIRIDEAPRDFSDAAVDLYEGNNGAQNKVCRVPLTHRQEFRFPGSYGCDNDEARSAVITKAPRGTWFKLGGDPRDLNSCSQGCVDVWVRRDITRPVTIGSFERSYSTDDVHVTRSGGTQQLDGKVSRMRVGMDF